ncbi:MAG: methyltransferase domain-containing protein [Halobacteriales archaeon]|nr:methyltransferase domain-containing protein [Halobacteriales archaeon]
MTVATRWNRLRYRLYAPVYDWAAKPLERGRRRAIDRLAPSEDDHILILGCGTGMDLEYLPAQARVTAIDLTPTMVERTAARAATLDREVAVGIGDAQSLPFADETFDAVLLHLVLSVVPEPTAVVTETARVLTPNGRVSIYDKFSPPDGSPSFPRRLVNPVARRLFADLNRPLEPMIAGTTLDIDCRETFLGGLYTVTIARPSDTEVGKDRVP